MMNYFDNLQTNMNKIGVNKGDILYFSSDIKALLFDSLNNDCYNGKEGQLNFLNNFLNEIINLIGEDGTLLIPAFSWSFCKGEGFDYYKTKSEVGALSNFILKNRKDFVRTQHPLYSFLVKGKLEDFFYNMSNQDAWGESSIFQFFKDYNTKQVLFNIEAYQGMTFAHYVEQSAKVPYRHPKYFFGKYRDKFGKEENRMYSMYVRDIDVLVNFGITNKFLIENNVARQTTWKHNTITLIELGKSYQVLYNDLKNNNGKNTLVFDKYTFDWNKKQTVPYEVGGLNWKN